MSAPPERPSAVDALVVVKAGLLTTIQDLGRPGWGRYGVSPSGAMDRLAARAANALAGNPPGAALLEITGPGADVTLDAGARGARRIAVAGADLGAEIADGVPGAGPRPLALWQPHELCPGARVRWTRRARGARAYLAISGGIAAPLVFGSAATDLGAGLGGLDGKPLRSGQSVPLAAELGPSSSSSPPSLLAAGELAARWYADPFRLRFIPAPGASAAALAIFTAAPYRLTPQSNRMGFRFDGGAGAALPVPPSSAERISEPLPAGTIQVPGDGRPILLMADRQTVGGYLAIGYVIRADLTRAAQLWPGDTVHFAAASLAEAEAASRQQGADLSALISG